MSYPKKILAGGLAALALSTTAVIALAAPLYQSPAEAAAGVTGKTLDEVTAERQSGKGYGAIAAEAGALDEFHEAVLEIHETALADDVEAGLLTQEQADAWLDQIRERQVVCNGDGWGRGAGWGYGRGMGRGCGMGRRANGSCPILAD